MVRVFGARQLIAAKAGRDRGSHTCDFDRCNNTCIAAGYVRTTTL